MSQNRQVCVTKRESLTVSGGQTEGMIRMNAITDLSDQICASRRSHRLDDQNSLLTSQ